MRKVHSYFSERFETTIHVLVSEDGIQVFEGPFECKKTADKLCAEINAKLAAKRETK